MGITLPAFRGCPLQKALGLSALIAVAFSCLPQAEADVIRLNNGSVIDGQIIRDDDSAVVILVRGAPQFYPADDVSAIIYSRIRIGPNASSKRAVPGTLAPQQALMDSAIVDKIRERLLTYHGFFLRVGTMLEYLRWKDFARAGIAAQRAAKWILPVAHGQFNPFSALADVLILFGLRVPALWLALTVVREPRGFIRIAEFIIPAYGLLMLMMAYVTVAPMLSVQLLLFPLAILGVGWIFIWMFSLTRGRALLAFLITIAVNASIEALLVHSQWLSVGLQSQMLQLAQR